MQSEERDEVALDEVADQPPPHFTLDAGAPIVVTTHAGALGDEWCAKDCVY